MNNQVTNLTVSNTEAKVRIIRGLIAEAKNHIFYVQYKKLDGTLREMQCRRHVSKGVKGTAKFDIEKVDQKHNQITVFDMNKDGFRKINVDTVQEIKVDGIKYCFEGAGETLTDLLTKALGLTEELCNDQQINITINTNGGSVII